MDGFFIEPYRIEVAHRSLTAAIVSPLKIGLISDLHTRAFGLRERKLIRLLETENPDVILIAGDTVGRPGDYGDVVTFLRRLHAPLGVWLVRGNWENQSLPRDERRLYASAGVHLLLNEARPIRPDVWLLGLDDPESGTARPDPARGIIPAGAYTIALFHSPAYFDRIAGTVPLALAGHTHGGQVRIPYLPVFWLSRGSGRFLEGWYAERDSHLYVTRGVGTSGIRARFLCRPELSIITLHPPFRDRQGAVAGGRRGREPSVSVGLPQVAPFDVVVQAGASQQFSVTVPCTDLPSTGVCPQGVSWRSSMGTISQGGTFTAPSSPTRGIVTATSLADNSKVGTAAVAVVGAVPVAQTCHARAVDVSSLSCSLPSISAGHTLVALVRVGGGADVRLQSFSDTVAGTWPLANLSSTRYESPERALAGGAMVFPNTKEHRSPVVITVKFSGRTGGDELAVWDFPGVYSFRGPAPAPVVGTDGVTPLLPMARAGDLVFAWSVQSQCFLNTPEGSSFTDISPAESCDVDAAAMVLAAPETNIKDRFLTDGHNSISGIMALSLGN